MTEQQSYELLVFAIKAIGVLVLLIGAAVTVARLYTPDFPNDDGERM